MECLATGLKVYLYLCLMAQPFNSVHVVYISSIEVQNRHTLLGYFYVGFTIFQSMKFFSEPTIIFGS